MTDHDIEKSINYTDKEEKEYEMGCKTSHICQETQAEEAVAQDENSGHNNEQNKSIIINKNGK